MEKIKIYPEKMPRLEREHLAAVFIKAVERFYKDPENQRAFEAWLAKEKEKEKEKEGQAV